ncbi:MAG: RtcB family protein, partial [Nitrospinota bacterium]
MEKGKIELHQVDTYVWEIPQQGEMRVPGRIYASKKILEEIRLDESPQQVANVACLPGIVKYSLAMPDVHWGYGFPIGGVAAMDVEEGVISPGGVGYDINCGVRLLRTNLTFPEVEPRLEALVEELYRNIPTGVGAKGGIGKLSKAEVRELAVKGIDWAIERGYATPADKDRTEELGRLAGADPDKVSEQAIERGTHQVGTLGSGNHFL